MWQHLGQAFRLVTTRGFCVFGGKYHAKILALAFRREKRQSAVAYVGSPVIREVASGGGMAITGTL
jgi:hypothetical protein